VIVHRRQTVIAALALAGVWCWMARSAPPASAANPVGTICGVAGLLNGLAGKACQVVQGGEKVLGGGRKAVSGGNRLLGGSSGSKARDVGLVAVGAWVLLGARSALTETGKIIDRTTSPQLQSTWFSSTYWRIAGLAAVLTMPFLFAAAVQALMRSDLAMLARATFVHLPLSLIAVGIAAPVTMLLLAASDQMSAVMASAAGNAGTRFLSHTSHLIAGLALVGAAPFIAFAVGLFTVAAAVVLWLELLMREAAVYVVVLMLPLAFASFVWPARRVWAVRSIELLVALILSKFAIVAVLALGGAALGQSGYCGVTGMLAGLVLVTMGAFAPWAMVRLLPLAELASGAAGSLRGEGLKIRRAAEGADELASYAFSRGDLDEDLADGHPDDGPARAARGESERLRDMAPVPVAAGAAPGDPDDEGCGDGGAPAGTNGAPAGTNGTPAGANGTPVDPSGTPAGPSGTSAGPRDGGSAPPFGANGSADAAAPVSEQRVPGLGPVFQMKNYSWRPFTLGIDDGWPPPPLAPSAGAPAQDGLPPDATSPGASPPDAPPPDAPPPDTAIPPPTPGLEQTATDAGPPVDEPPAEHPDPRPPHGSAEDRDQ